METALTTPSDWELLQEYAAAGSEEAFSALVHRHLNLVYAVAFRYCSDAGTAEEVANNVFSMLARKAHTLSRDIVVAGWLFKTARYAAANARNFQSRRRRWEEEAAGADPSLFQASLAGAEGEVAKAWEIIAEQLDEAVAKLSEPDRNAILLRFYESKTLREIGAELGMSEEAARKRTTRALDKLRKSMAGRGVACSAATLALALATYPAQSAPAGMAAMIAQGATILPTGTPAPPGQSWTLKVRSVRGRLLQYVTIAVLTGIVIYGGARFFLQMALKVRGPRDVFLRQMQAVQSGDGESYAQTLHFNNEEERQLRQVFVDSIRLQFDLRTNLVQRFGNAAFSQSPFPAFLDILDTNRISQATETIQGNRAVLTAPWGSRLPFVAEQREWKLDFFMLPGVQSAARYRITAEKRNRALAAVARELQMGSYNNIQEAYASIQRELKRPAL